MIVRHLHPDEHWPDNVPVGFEGPQLDRDWCWVIENEVRIWGGLMACPMHGAIFLLRVVVVPGAPPGALRMLLSRCLKEAKQSGCYGFITLIEQHTKAGRKLAHLAQRAGGTVLPNVCNLAYGGLR